MQSVHEHHVAIRGKRVAVLVQACADDEFIGVCRQGTLRANYNIASIAGAQGRCGAVAQR